MRVNPNRGQCRECGSALDIVDADDATMTVECQEGHTYPLEHDAFGDHYMTAVIAYLADQLEGAEES